MTGDDSFEIPPRVVTRRVRDELVIVDLESGTYFGLDSVGARAWELMAAGLPPSRICDRMHEEYDVDREELERDIADLVAALVERRLIEPRR